MTLNRRTVLGAAAASLAFAGLARSQEETDETYLNEVQGYGPLVSDPYRIFDLPAGFSYQVISQAGETMDDGLSVPYKFDGMGCLPLGRDRVALVRNHELKVTDVNHGPLGLGRHLSSRLDRDRVYDLDDDGFPLPGGTTTLIYDLRSRKVLRQHLSLAGTIINCAGGVTPWGSWLSCEETTTQAGFNVGKDHGYVFEVPAKARGLVDPVPLKAMGRFKHEAACIDPRTGIAYMTEDLPDSLFYRFIPDTPGELAKGGRLQALGFSDTPGGCDSRNWEGATGMAPGSWRDTRWIDLDEVDNPNDDLRLRGAAKGATLFARGEGVFWGKDEVYFTCTSGGANSSGQIMRHVPGEAGGRTQLFHESTNPKVMDMADNIAISPWGHLLVCEDRYSDTDRNHLRAVTPEGKVYTLGRNVYRDNAELAGVCFSPDGTTLFVNIQWPGITLAITGPWASLKT
jgi:secreted PhoX family phosphatase